MPSLWRILHLPTFPTLPSSPLSSISWPQLLFTLAFLVLSLPLLFKLALPLMLPVPRAPQPQEKTYVTLQEDGRRSAPVRLESWYDTWTAHERKGKKRRGKGEGERGGGEEGLERAEVVLSLVVPAYNEEARIEEMLREAIAVLRELFPPDGRATSEPPSEGLAEHKPADNGTTPQHRRPVPSRPNGHTGPPSSSSTAPTGFEILIVDDGSTDSTVPTVLAFLSTLTPPLPPSTVRIIPLASNRGKGGAVTHGLRHVRGQLALFADADGASKFADISKLLSVMVAQGWWTPASPDSEKGYTPTKPGIVIGSRAWMTRTPSVTKRNPLRNLLMRAFHLLLHTLTPPQTRRIQDTQCGFKMFTRASLPRIVPRMRCEGWVFDVEMLMRAEKEGVGVREVAVGWREVGGSKLGIVGACWAMGWGVAVLRGWWGIGEL